MTSINNIAFGKVASSAAIFKDGKILLIKRAESCVNFPGTWTFPAGGIEESDLTHNEAIIREVKEETNLDFVPQKKFNFYETTNNNKRYFSLVHLGEWNGEVKLQVEEASEFGFFTYENTKSLELAFSYREAVEDLHRAGLLI